MRTLAILASLVFAGTAVADDGNTLSLPDHFFGDLVAMFAFGLLAIALIIVGYKIFDRLTPDCDYEKEISKGNVSAGITVAAVILGLCYVVAHVIAAVIG